MEDSFIIEGGTPLKGTVHISGAKNVALKVLIGAMLFEGKVLLHNIPRIGDVFELLQLMNALGAKAEFIEKNTVFVDTSGLHDNTLDLLSASKIRVSFMLFAPLLHKFKEAHIPNPGGCRLGARPIDRIVDGMKALGVEVSYDSDSGYFHATMKNLPEGTFTFPKVSHTGTELLIMIGVFSSGTVVIENAALEPEIDDLIAFFNEAGADIQRKGTSVVIKGTSSLKQQKPFAISADRNEAATYAVLGIATKGDVTVTDVRPSDLTAFNAALEEAGAGVEQVNESSIRYYYKGPLKPLHIETMPHPGFMTDWQPPMAVLLTQSNGVSTIHERMFENRFSYVDELKKLGASIEYIDMHIENPASYYEFNYEPDKEYKQAIQITGTDHLHNGVLKIADLRAGATLAIGALIASGESVIAGAVHLERGYEDFVGKVQSLGGTIEKK